MSSPNLEFHNPSSTQDVQAAADSERDFGTTFPSYSGKVWRYLVTIPLIDPSFLLFPFFVCLAHNNKFIGALQSYVSIYSRCYSWLFLGYYYVSFYMIPALFIDSAASDLLTNLKALRLQSNETVGLGTGQRASQQKARTGIKGTVPLSLIGNYAEPLTV